MPQLDIHVSAWPRIVASCKLAATAIRQHERAVVARVRAEKNAKLAQELGAKGSHRAFQLLKPPTPSRLAVLRSPDGLQVSPHRVDAAAR
eukprot:12266495-Alexandrium_andersonii.AAC.1